MAIQLPKIEEEQQGAQPAPAIRLDAPALNTAAPMQQAQNALEGAGKEIVKYRDQMAYQEADNISQGADNTYQSWHKKEMYGDPATGKVGLIYQEGDPKVIFKDFNDRAKAKLKELSTAPDGQDWSGLTQTVVNRRLNRRDQELRDEELTQYGASKYKYDKLTSTTNSDFAAKSMPSLAAQVDPDHPETFGPLQAKMHDVAQPLISNALQYGGAVQPKDEDGNPIGQPVLTPAIKAQAQKAVSEALRNTIDNLYHSDQGDGVSIKKAQAIKAQFADQLDPFDKDTLDTKAQTAMTKQKSLQLANIIQTKGVNAPEVAAAPLEVRQQAMKFANEYGRDMQQMKERKQKLNMDIASKALDQVQQSDRPYTGPLQMQNDPKIARVWDNLSAQQQQALEHQVVAPKVTAPATQQKWNDLIDGKDPDGNKLQGMSKSTLTTYMAGMNTASQREATSQWNKLNSPTGGVQQQQYTNVAKEFERQAIGAGLVKNAPNSNVLQANDQPKYQQYRKELTDSLDLSHPMDPQQTSAYVATFVANKVANSAFKQPSQKSFNGSTKAAPPASTTSAPPNVPAGSTSPAPLKGAAGYYGNLTEQAKMTWMMNYRKDPANGASNGKLAPAPTKENLIKYIDQQANGK